MKLINKKNVITLTGFQLAWLFCVFGEYYNHSLLGIVAGFFYLLFFFYLNNNRLRALKICIIFSLIGYIFDSILSFNKIFLINSNITFGYLPIWFLVLWPSFTTLFVDLLVFLRNHIYVAFLMGSLLVPPTYYLGIPLGLAESNNLLLAMIIMMFFWGFFLSFYSFFINKIN